MTRPDKSMTTSSSSSSMPSPSSASGHNSMGGSSTFDLTTVMKKIENAGSSSSWTKVEKASVLLKQLIESFGVLSSEQEETIGTSVAQCMRRRPFIPADCVGRNALIALCNVVGECVSPRILLCEWLASELSELLQRWRLSLSLFCDESFAMTAARKPVRAALVAVGEDNVNNNDNEEVKKQHLVIATTAVFILRSAEEAGRLRVNLRRHVYELIKIGRDRRLKFPEGPLRDAVDKLTENMNRELTKPQGLNERRTRTLESMAHPLRNKASDVIR